MDYYLYLVRLATVHRLLYLLFWLTVNPIKQNIQDMNRTLAEVSLRLVRYQRNPKR
jgi:hypothetical protein